MRSVKVDVSVFDKNGNCRLDDANHCLEGTQWASLPAEQLPRVVDTDCDDGAWMGPCVSACTQDCKALSGTNLVACKQGCPVTCQEAFGIGRSK
jgi:hypothetical protein